MFEEYFTQTLKKDEELVEILHRHWPSFAKPGLISLVLIIVPLLFIKFIIASSAATIVLLVYLAGVLAYLGYRWVTWYFDVFIITDQRIIDIEQKGVFHRTVSEASLGRVQDVTYTVQGFLATLMNFGSVQVRTASDGELKLTDIKDPEEVQEMIIELLSLSQSQEKMSAEELVSYIGGLKEKKAGADDDLESTKDSEGQE